MKLHEVMSSSAFTVMDPEFENVFAFVSGDYVTIGYAFGTEVSLDETGPWQHGLGRDGLYGADAADLYDKAREMIRNWALGEGE